MVKELLKAVANLSPIELKEFRKGMTNALGLKGAMGARGFDITGGLGQAGDDITARLEMRKELFKSIGMASDELGVKLGKLEETSRELFGSIEEGYAALSGLGDSMQSISFISSDMALNLAHNASVLNEFGVGFSTTGEILDTAALSFGATEQELHNLTEQLGTIVSSFPGQASTIAQNFSNAQKSLLYDSSKIMDTFKRMQAVSSRTGVSFDDLTSAFGDSMDTFEGSAGKAGKLNAILGKSVFNSIDLLGKTEAERIETIIAGVKKNVNVESLKKNKFQLKSIAAGLGLSPDATRRLLSGKATVEEALKSKEDSDPRVRASKAVSKALGTSTMSMEQLTTEFKLNRGVLENFRIAQENQIRRGAIDRVKGGFGIVGQTDVNNLTDILEGAINRASLSLSDPEIQKAMKEIFAGGSFNVSAVKDLGSLLKDQMRVIDLMKIEQERRADAQLGDKLPEEKIAIQIGKASGDLVDNFLNKLGFTGMTKEKIARDKQIATDTARTAAATEKIAAKNTPTVQDPEPPSNTKPNSGLKKPAVGARQP